MDPTLPALAELAAQRRGDLTVACAKTFTVGLLAQSLASATGSGEWFRGGVIACRSQTNRELLGSGEGPLVEESAAAAMARGVAELFGSDVGIATVGVAGPEDRDGRPPGTVVIGWSVKGRARAETINFRGDPGSLRLKGTRAALARLSGAMSEH